MTNITTTNSSAVQRCWRAPDDDHRDHRELHDRTHGGHDGLTPDPQLAEPRHDESEKDEQHKRQSELPGGLYGHRPIMSRFVQGASIIARRTGMRLS